MACLALPNGDYGYLDDDRIEEFAPFSWHWSGPKRKQYISRCEYRRGKSPKQIYLHYQVWGKPVPEGMRLDHKDGDTRNNHLSNLRLCTIYGNARNAKRKCNNTSGFIGVSLDKKLNKWASYTRYSGERQHLGFFKSKIEAAIARDDAVLEHHGEFAKLNFPFIYG